ncbi:MAG TPA: hypothetical protein VGO66_12865 [Solirubrobacterales bacterium]|jgi:hypothetical protein|nr:hypothetical protein [Solirubrobacterales bacterium]
MRESAKRKQRKKEERKRNIILIAGGAALLLMAVGGAVVLASGGGGHAANGCVIVDVSESTEVARQEYGEEFSDFATSIGLDGSGDMCVIFAAADPLAESLAEPLFVGPAESKKGGIEERSDVEAKVAVAREDLESSLAGSSLRDNGSALIEAGVEAAQFLQPGDRLLYLSDGLQWTPELHLSKLDLTPTAIARLLAEMEAEGLIPDLEGVEISFPFMLYHPGGIDDAKVRRITDFWEEWAERARADITVRESVKP